MKSVFIATVLIFFLSSAYAQSDSTATDSVKHKAAIAQFWNAEPHSPGRAALYSAIIPGLGQAYNRKYWKIPIVYAGLGTSVYFIYYWNGFYTDLKNAYLWRTDDDSLTVDTQYSYITSNDILLQYVDLTRKYTDLMFVVTGAVYLLNIIDAIVDGHLYDFNVNDDLSMHLEPYFRFPSPLTGTAQTFGISLKCNLK